MLKNAKSLQFTVSDDLMDIDIIYEYSNQLYTYSMYISKMEIKGSRRDVNST